MSIFTKLKTATDFSASVIKEGFALIWPEKKSDGSVALQVKLEDGSVKEIGGGGTVDESRLLPEAPDNGDVPVFNAAAATGGAWENQNLNEQIDSKIATHNSDPSAHPDKLPLSGGQMTGALKINTTDAVRINNGDYGVFFRKDASLRSLGR